MDKLERMTSILRSKKKQKKKSINKDVLQRVVNDVESTKTFQNRKFLAVALEETAWAKKLAFKAKQLYQWISSLKIECKTPSKKGRPKGALTKIKEARREINPPKDRQPDKYSQEASKRVQLRKLDIDQDLEISRQYQKEMGFSGRVVYFPSGRCPIPLKKNGEDFWARDVLNYGISNGVLYYPSALFYFLREFYESYTNEYHLAKNRVAEYFVNRGLGKFI